MGGSIQRHAKIEAREPASLASRRRRWTEDRRRALTARGRKVRAPQGREVGNTDPGRPEGKRNRNDTA